MTNTEKPRALLAQMLRLRSDVLAQAEVFFRSFRARITRSDFEPSARNLACYLALRQHDLRHLQLALSRWGLSSLGRSESCVEPTLDAVTRTLNTLVGDEAKELPPYPAEEAVQRGARLIERQAESLFGKAKPNRATRIMITLPAAAAEDLPLLQGLLHAGIECVRINCAHDDKDVWSAMLRNLRQAERDTGSEPVRLLMDLAGPKVRTRRPKKQEKDVYISGDRLLLTAFDPNEIRKRQKSRGAQGENAEKLPVVGCTIPGVVEHLKVGDRVFVDDGQIGARVRELAPLGAILQIERVRAKGRKIRSDKGLNFPDTELELAALTDKDREDLDFVVQHADMIGYSFVQTEDDIQTLLAEIAARAPSGKLPGLVLKIETQRAVNHLPGLLVTAAGQLPAAVMIARGDLAVELGFARIAEIQEEILWLCEAAHVPVIWATQVLEGLAKTNLPSRAEVTDAAMAGRAECVMLNKGPHIIAAVEMLATVLDRMQGHQHKKTPQLRALHAWDGAFSGPNPKGASSTHSLDAVAT